MHLITLLLTAKRKEMSKKMETHRYGIFSILKKSRLLLFLGLAVSVTACKSTISNDKLDENKPDSKQERPVYDDMTDLIRYSPLSKNNNNFLVINPEIYPKASAFKAEVQVSEEIKDRHYEFVTVWDGRIDAENSYLHIPEEFVSGKEVKYAIMLTALDGSGNILAQGPVPTSADPLALAEPAPNPHFYSMVTCNGPDYAYNLASYTNHENNPTKYKIEMVSQRFSPNPNETGELEIKYYQYMDENQFSAWELQNPPTGHWGGDPNGGPVYSVDVLFPGQLPAGEYYNSQNNLIEGPVYAVEKDFGPWKGDASIGEDNLSSPYFPDSDFDNWNGFSSDFTFNNDQDLIHFSSKINHDIIPEDSRYGEELVCKQVGINGSHYSGGTSGTSPKVNKASLIFKDCLGRIITVGGGSAGGDNVIQITDCGDEDSGEGIGSTSGGFGVYSVSFDKIDAYKRTKPVTVTLYPERFKKDGYHYSLEEGLYNVTVVTQDQTVIRYLKKVNSDEEHKYDPNNGRRR